MTGPSQAAHGGVDEEAVDGMAEDDEVEGPVRNIVKHKVTRTRKTCKLSLSPPPRVGSMCACVHIEAFLPKHQ